MEFQGVVRGKGLSAYHGCRPQCPLYPHNTTKDKAQIMFNCQAMGRIYSTMMQLSHTATLMGYTWHSILLHSIPFPIELNGSSVSINVTEILFSWHEAIKFRIFRFREQPTVLHGPFLSCVNNKWQFKNKSSITFILTQRKEASLFYEHRPTDPVKEKRVKFVLNLNINFRSIG